ncbi:MAG: cadmium-translocating P-type ATPase [Clostridiaceae bacterium]|jgi:Cd2+/Zn2+-exporting ATPase|nr:cadmium-translocating P-type ATPase [Clostridiaceae bacterium]
MSYKCCNGKQNQPQKPGYNALLIRLLLSTIIFFIAFFANNNVYLFIISYLLSGWDILYKALNNTLKGQLFDENFLMSIATVGALIIGEYPEATAVMLFFQAGELLQDVSVGKSTKAIKALINIMPDYATLVDGTRVNPNDIMVGENIVVKAGEKIPFDGEIVQGTAYVDASALTGESILKDLVPGDTVLGGYICQDGALTIRVDKPYNKSTAAKIIELTELASKNKSQTERLITHFAKLYTPIVIAAALLTAILPPLFLDQSYTKWIYTALVFLVVSCPCALVISIPLGYFGGIGRASKKGILIKGGSYLDLLTKVDTVVFDKTGTLTKGCLKIKEVNSNLPNLLEIAAYAEYYSNHPMAQAILHAYSAKIDKLKISEFTETAGKGITVKIDGKQVRAGNEKFVKNAHPTEHAAVHFSIDDDYAGFITLTDEIKPEAGSAIQRLKNDGIKKIAILTGDTEISGSWVANELGIKEAYYSLLPQDKLNMLTEIKKHGVTAYIGDGINDAPALALADIGVAMGGLGSDAAIEAADVVIMGDNLNKLTQAIEIAQFTHRTVWQNIILSISVKVSVMILATINAATMWHAVFADVGVAMFAIINTTKLLFIKTGGNKKWQ